jgi:hypothetical protein
MSNDDTRFKDMVSGKGGYVTLRQQTGNNVGAADEEGYRNTTPAGESYGDNPPATES